MFSEHKNLKNLWGLGKLKFIAKNPGNFYLFLKVIHFWFLKLRQIMSDLLIFVYTDKFWHIVMKFHLCVYDNYLDIISYRVKSSRYPGFYFKEYEVEEAQGLLKWSLEYGRHVKSEQSRK
jgi:hypothetical protein